MTTNNKTRRVGVFIDAQNVFLTTQEVYGQGRINYRRLLEYLAESDRSAIFTFSVFMCYDPDNESQYRFLNALGLIGYRVISKPIRKLPDGSVKANMDMEMAIEVLTQAPYLDEIVLITGDGDFKALVDRLCEMGKIVRVIGPDRLTSPELIQACHQFMNLHRIEGILDAPE